MLKLVSLAAFTCVVVAGMTGRSIAGENVACQLDGTSGYVMVETPETSTTTAARPVVERGGPSSVCRLSTTLEIVPCSNPTLGWWSNTDGCYYQRLDPPPAATSPAWEGHFPDGAVYQATCLGVAGTGGGWLWRATPPPGFGGEGVTVQQLADQAIASLALSGPDIGLAPDPAKTGLVGLPVWMWSQVAPTTWGPQTATATLPGLAVTATAQATRIVWSMGDGHNVTCDGPGTPFSRTAAATTSPTCGYVYTRSSADQPGGAYALTATTTWDIAWAGNGAAGQVTQTRTSAAQVRIGELQVLVS